MQFLYLTILVLAAFGLGVYLAPIIRGDYADFKAYVETQLHLAEQKARSKALSTINKL